MSTRFVNIFSQDRYVSFGIFQLLPAKNICLIDLHHSIWFRPEIFSLNDQSVVLLPELLVQLRPVPLSGRGGGEPSLH